MKTFIETLPCEEAYSPTLTAYLLDGSPELPGTDKRPAVLILPGGSYQTCSDREAEPIAMQFCARGFQAFVLRYSVGEDASFAEALGDARAALRRIREMADQWQIHPGQVAVCGFSAGGHLAAATGIAVAMEQDGAEIPAPGPGEGADALILGYPCIQSEMSAIFPFGVPSLHPYVTRETPPAFLFHTADDDVVPVENSLCFASALAAASVPFALHVYPAGVHGLSLATAQTAGGRAHLVEGEVAGWTELCFRFLERQLPHFGINE